jgi:hypothetical protein
MESNGSPLARKLSRRQQQAVEAAAEVVAVVLVVEDAAAEQEPLAVRQRLRMRRLPSRLRMVSA